MFLNYYYLIKDINILFFLPFPPPSSPLLHINVEAAKLNPYARLCNQMLAQVMQSETHFT